MRALKKVLCLSLALLLLAVLFTACGEKAPDPVNTNTCSYEEMVAYLTAKGYNYCDGSFTPHFHVTPVNENTVNVAIETEVPNTYIFYTTDLTLPTRQSAIYLGPVNLRRGTHIKILPVYNDTERDSIYEFIIK